jgi:hypothetical protein
VSEALAFSGIDAGTLDVSFHDAREPVVQKLERVGLRFDLPQLQDPLSRAAPGSDPKKPPRLI